MSEHLGLNNMNKQDLRKKLAEDAQRWIEEHGQPDLYAGQSSPQEHFRLCGSKFKRKVYRERDTRHEQYQQWLQQERRARM